MVTLGEQGALILTDGAVNKVPGITVEVTDSTGAGDAFNAGLAVALADGKELRDAVLWSMAAGAIAVTRPGAQQAMPTRQEVEDFLRSI